MGASPWCAVAAVAHRAIRDQALDKSAVEKCSIVPSSLSTGYRTARSHWLLVKGMLAHVLQRVDPDLVLCSYLKRVHDDDERLNLIGVATWQDDLTKLRLLYSDQARYPFVEAPVEALESATERGRLDLIKELCSLHKGISSARALEIAAANGHSSVVEFLSSRGSVTGE